MRIKHLCVLLLVVCCMYKMMSMNFFYYYKYFFSSLVWEHVAKTLFQRFVTGPSQILDYLCVVSLRIYLIPLLLYLGVKLIFVFLRLGHYFFLVTEENKPAERCLVWSWGTQGDKRKEEMGDMFSSCFTVCCRREKGNYVSVLFEFVSFHWVHCIFFLP